MTKTQERVNIFCNTVMSMRVINRQELRTLALGLAKFVQADGHEAGMQKGYRMGQKKRKAYQK